MNYKGIVVTWLFKTDLTNMNAGEGSSNLKEIKSYNNGLPYISGQSMRHALRQAMKRENPEGFKCTPEFPCGNIETCWTCDLFGYLLPSDGAKRWSPIKASPALGQIRTPITTDLIFRMVEDIKCPNCNKKMYPLSGRDKDAKKIEGGKTELTCVHCSEKFKADYDIRQALAYKQLIENIYKASISIDMNNIGVEEVPVINSDNGYPVMDGTEDIANVECSEKLNRVKAILNGIYNLTDFANQSREMSNATPDVVVISLQKRYNHRLSSALRLDEEGNIDEQHLKSVINDCLSSGDTKIFAGYISGIVKNEEKMKNVFDSLSNNDNFELFDSPKIAFDKVIETLECDNNGST